MAGTYHVDSDGSTLECSLRGRIKLGRGTNVTVGDLVRVERVAAGSFRICELLPRTSTLSRLGVARRREQVIAANVDQVAAVFATTRPDPDFSMLDRLLVVAEMNGLPALVILNKRDLLPADAPVPPPTFDPYREAGYPILVTSSIAGDGLEALRQRLQNRITVLTGPSGAGKSSLLNALMPGLNLRIGEVGARKGKGRHTTVSAALYPIPGGGYVADTPGLQYLALWDADPASLASAFPEIRELAPDCRFADCRHRVEPSCAVLAAVGTPKLAENRYRSYRALLEESEVGR